MRITGNQTVTKTLTDLLRALDHRTCVTLTYVDSKGDTTIRTVEIHEVHAKDGDADALYIYELERDPDDADYRPRVRLAA